MISIKKKTYNLTRPNIALVALAICVVQAFNQKPREFKENIVGDLFCCLDSENRGCVGVLVEDRMALNRIALPNLSQKRCRRNQILEFECVGCGIGTDYYYCYAILWFMIYISLWKYSLCLVFSRVCAATTSLSPNMISLQDNLAHTHTTMPLSISNEFVFLVLNVLLRPASDIGFISSWMTRFATCNSWWMNKQTCEFKKRST